MMERWDRNSIIRFHEEHEGHYAGDTSSWEIIRLSKSYIGSRALDGGSEPGALVERIPNAVGLDLVSKAPRIVKGDISNMPFKKSSFDTVFATEMAEHLDDGRSCWRNSRKSGREASVCIKYPVWGSTLTTQDIGAISCLSFTGSEAFWTAT